MQLFKTKQQRGARRTGKTVRASGGFAFFRVAALFVAVILTLPFLPLRLSMAAEDSFDITVKTTWVDNENNARIRPSFVTIGLMANGVPAVHKNGDPVASQNLDHENGWTCVFDSLPTVDGAGSAIEYTLVQTNLNSDYTTDFEPTTLTWLSYTSEIEVINTTEKGVLKGQLIVTKQDRETGEPLPGATFALTLKGSTKTYTGITDENGTYTFIVPLGEYTLTEVKAPAGYEPDTRVRDVNLVEGSEQGVSVRMNAPRRSPSSPRVPADGDPIQAWTAFDTNLRWMIDSEGTLFIAPVEGETSGTLSGRGNVTAWPWNALRSRITGVSVQSEVVCAADSRCMFQNCENMTFAEVDGMNVSNVIQFADMFNGCVELTQIIGLDTWTNNGTAGLMQRMFKNCAKLTAVSLPNFYPRTGGQIQAQEMFFGCSKLETVDLSGFRRLSSGNSHNFTGMFENCIHMKTLDLGEFSVYSNPNVQYARMFRNCQSLTSLDLSGIRGRARSASNMFNGCITLQTLNLQYFDTSSLSKDEYDLGLRSCASLTTLVADNASIRMTDGSTTNDKLNNSKFFTDGMWKKASTGLGDGDPEYTVREISSSLNGDLLPADTYVRTSMHANGFEKIPQADYVINNLGRFEFVTVGDDSRFQTYSDANGATVYSTYQNISVWDAGVNANDQYVIPGPIVLRFFDAATDVNGDLHDIIVTFNEFRITNVTGGRVPASTPYKRLLFTVKQDGTFMLRNYRVTDDSGLNYNPAYNKLKSGDSGTYADINVRIDGAKTGETFLFFVNDLDLHDGRGSDSAPQYGEGSEGVFLGDGFDLSTVVMADGTLLNRYRGLGDDFIPDDDGAYLFASSNDNTSVYSKFYVAGSAAGSDGTGSNFIWTSGNSCDTYLFEKEGALVPVAFEKIDADTLTRSYLEGAILKVINPSGTRLFQQWVTGKTSRTVFLMSGEYILQEVYTPNGRKIADNIPFTVLDNGRVIVDGVLQDTGTGLTGSVTMENKYAVTLRETVLNSRLTTLTIYRPDGMAEQDFWYTVTEGSSSVQVCIPAGEDHVTLSGIISGRTYEVTERDWSWRYRLDATMDNAHLTTAGKPYYQSEDAISGVYRNLPSKTGAYAARLTAVNDPQRNTVAYSGPRVDNEWLSGIERETNIFTLRVSDPVTHENWINYLAHNTEYTGRVWADKSVTAEAEITVGALGYAPVTVRKTTGADFLVDFSLHSSTVNEMIPGAIYEEGSPLKQNPGETAYVTYTDHLGPYMTAVNMNKLVYGNNAYTVKYDAANSTETKDVYTVEGTVTSDLTGEPCSLSDIIIEVEHSADLATGDTVTVKVPDYLIPMRVFNVRDNEGQTQMSIDRIRPLHLFYSVAPKHELKDHVRGDNLMTGSDLDAWNTYFTDPANAGESGKTVKFYATDPAQGAQVQYVPSDKNHFAFFVNDTPLYDDDHQYATTPPDENGDPTFDLTKYHYHVYHYEFYDATLSTGELPQSGQWYDARRVNDTVGARYEMVDGVNISPEIVWDSENGYWKIPAGVFKEIHRYTMESQKTENVTGTDTFVYSNTMDPAHNLTGTFGNNGVVFVDKQLQ